MVGSLLSLLITLGGNPLSVLPIIKVRFDTWKVGISFSLPENWSERRRKIDDGSLTLDYFSNEKSADNWTTILSISIIKGHKYGTLLSFFDWYDRSLIAVCNVKPYTLGPYLFTEKGFPVAVQFSRCNEIHGKPYGQTVLNKVISVPEGDFILQWSWKYAKQSSNTEPVEPLAIALASLFLYTVTTCERERNFSDCGVGVVRLPD